jgi:hypothetical protein
LDLLDSDDSKKILSKNLLKIFEIFEIKNFLFGKKSFSAPSNRVSSFSLLHSALQPSTHGNGGNLQRI